MCCSCIFRKCIFLPCSRFSDAANFHPAVFIVLPILILMMIVLCIVYRYKRHKVTSKFPVQMHALNAYAHRQVQHTNTKKICVTISFIGCFRCWSQHENDETRGRGRRGRCPKCKLTQVQRLGSGHKRLHCSWLSIKQTCGTERHTDDFTVSVAEYITLFVT